VDRRRGGALVAVLWLSAALAAVALSLAATVRSEVERTSTQLDGARAYYLATGALQRAMLYVEWGGGAQEPGGTQRYFAPGMSRMRFSFPTGDAEVEIMPESGKINLNRAAPDELLRLLAALGVERVRAEAIVAAILDWRTRPPGGGPTPFDEYYLSLTPSFPSRHASFQETEELLLLKGMTPDLYYGTLQSNQHGELHTVAGLADCVTTLGEPGPVDVNTAPLPVLVAAGLSPQDAAAVIRGRQAEPFRTLDRLRVAGLLDSTRNRLGIGGGPIYTLRATARGRTPDGKPLDAIRSVGATVRFEGAGDGSAYQVLRWRDHVWAGEAQ
jgi:general secretion pathway protein K